MQGVSEVSLRRPTGTKDEGDEHNDSEAEEVTVDYEKKYCLCQNVAFGGMVACDNNKCPYEWLHWSCVGLKSEPRGVWYCPECQG